MVRKKFIIFGFMIGKQYKHKYLPDYTCEIIAETKKGYKVRQKTGRKKPVIKFFNYEDFTGDWIEDK